MKQRWNFAGFFLAVICVDAHANIGIPMLAIVWPIYWIAILPIIGIEAYVAKRDLKTSWGSAWFALSTANGLSTLIGIPVVWALFLAFEFTIGANIMGRLDWNDPFSSAIGTILSAAWLGPTESSWQIYLAFAVLAIPFCMASIWIEYRIVRRMFSGVENAQVLRTVVRGNVLSYTTLIGAGLLYPLLTT